MSYDLMVFAPETAPRERQAFMEWYDKLTQWSEDYDYFDPSNLRPELQAWYRDMKAVFPAMNGPDAVADCDPKFDASVVADYSFAGTAIYIAFTWDVAQEAYERSLNCAAIHNVGFFDVSADDGAVWAPGADGYDVVHGGTQDDRQIQLALTKFLAERG